MITKIRNHIPNEWLTGFFGAGALLFISMTVVNIGNYAFNLILGRWLGPTAFSDLSLIVTIVLMSGFVTAAFQLTSAKFAAVFSAEDDPQRMAAARRWLHRGTYLVGGIILFLFAGGSLFWQKFFQMQSAVPFIILGLTLPIYIIQGVDRGALQGQLKFKRLAGSYQAEMWARLLLSLLLVAIGLSVNGAVLAIGLSFVAAWLVARRVGPWTKENGQLSKDEKKIIAAFAGPVILAYAGQILIANSDIVVVKRFFSPQMAGQYAALALIGRIVFFATWSIVTVIFPMVAKKHQRGEPHRQLLKYGVGIVAAISSLIILATWLFPEFIIQLLFGPAYLNMAPLLWLYAVATALFAMANVFVNYHLSTGRSLGTWLAVSAGLAQVGLLVLLHDSLQQVIIVQIVLMSALLAALVIWDQWLYHHSRRVFIPVELGSNP